MNVPHPSPEKRRKLNSSSENMEQEATNSLPKISDLIGQDDFPPAAFSTTLPQITTVQSGEITTTIPVNAQILVPVLPECIPLIAQVPDVVTETQTLPTNAQSTDTMVKEEVKISQVLPGYAPSYASDYVPSEVNTTSYNSFVNTLSFNVSRYPTLTEITDSKNYSKKAAQNLTPTTAAAQGKKSFDYVPAEYLTGQDTGFQAKTYVSMCSLVKPEVLSSGRVLTTMCVPIFQGDPEENIMKRNESSEADLEGSNKVTKEDLDNTENTPEKPSNTQDDKSEKENFVEAGSINSAGSITSSTTSAGSVTSSTTSAGSITSSTTSAGSITSAGFITSAGDNKKSAGKDQAPESKENAPTKS